MVEFALLLPMFLGSLFATVTLMLLLVQGELTLYATHVAARTEAVGGSSVQAAREVLPAGNFKAEGSKVQGHYQVPAFLHGGGALANPFAGSRDLKTSVSFHRWPNGGGLPNCKDDDNPVHADCVSY